MSYIINPYQFGVSFSPNDIAGLKLWLKADAITGLNDGDTIATWEDSSTQNNDATQSTEGFKPTYQTNELNGKPIVRFDGTNDRFVLPDFASGFSAGELFIVIKIDTDPPAASGQTGICRFGTDAASTHYCWTDGIIYDGFGTTARKTTVNPTPALTSWRLYNVGSKASEWKSRLDGTEIFSTGTNTVAFTTAPLLGVSDSAVTLYWLDGDVAEIIMYDSVLSSGDRDSVETYIANKYGLTIA